MRVRVIRPNDEGVIVLRLVPDTPTEALHIEQCTREIDVPEHKGVQRVQFDFSSADSVVQVTFSFVSGNDCVLAFIIALAQERAEFDRLCSGHDGDIVFVEHRPRPIPGTFPACEFYFVPMDVAETRILTPDQNGVGGNSFFLPDKKENSSR